MTSDESLLLRLLVNSAALKWWQDSRAWTDWQVFQHSAQVLHCSSTACVTNSGGEFCRSQLIDWRWLSNKSSLWHFLAAYYTTNINTRYTLYCVIICDSCYFTHFNDCIKDVLLVHTLFTNIVPVRKLMFGGVGSFCSLFQTVCTIICCVDI